MECREVRDRLQPFLDGELPAGELRSVNSHLEGCPDCRAVFGGEGGWQRGLRAELRSVRSPRDVWSRIAQAITDADRRAGGGLVGGRSPSPAKLALWGRRIAKAAVPAVVVLALVTLLRPGPWELPPRAPEAARHGAEVVHRHSQLPSLFGSARPDLTAPDFDQAVARFAPPTADGRPRRFLLRPGAAPEPVHRVFHEVRSEGDVSLLHVGFNCGGVAASLVIVPGSPAAVDVVASLGRGAKRQGQYFHHRREGEAWLVVLSDRGHDVAYLLEAFDPPLTPEPAE